MRLLILLACVAACAPPPIEVPDYVDLVTGADDLLQGEPPVVEQQLCAEQYRRGLVLHPGQSLRAAVRFERTPTLRVGGCVSSRHGERDPVGLAVAVRSGKGGAALFETRLDPPSVTSWWEREVPLSGVENRSGTLELEVVLPEGRSLLLTDLVIEQRRSVEARRPAAEIPQILLISVDTLREDGIGALGGETPTPYLDRFVQQAERFSPHYAAATYTKPSHASLLTGQLPPLHQMGDPRRTMPPGLPLLAELLHAAGLRTAGLVYDCEWLDPRFGFDRGFEEYASVHWELGSMSRYAYEWMLERRGEPFFFFLHTFEPHSDFMRQPYEGPLSHVRTLEDLFGVEGYGCRQGACASGLLDAIRDGEIAPLPGEDEILRFTYEQGVTTADARLGQLFQDLEEAGLFDRMLIVLTSDHGELLLEHGEVLHGPTWEEVVRVPLLVKWPFGERAGETRSIPTSSIDVMPTLLVAAGLGTRDLPGQPLQREITARPIFSGHLERMVLHRGYKAIKGPRRQALFHLAEDPGESRDLRQERPELFEELLELMSRRRKADVEARQQLPTEAPHIELSAEEKERLRSLGYLD